MTVDPSEPPDDLEVSYRFVTELPEELRQPTIVNLHGELRTRGPAVATIHLELLHGRMPPAEELSWPHEPLRGAFFRALEASGICPICDGDPELASEVVGYVLREMDHAERFFERALIGFQAIAPDRPTLAEVEAVADEGCEADAERLALELAAEGFEARLSTQLDDRASLLRELSEVMDALERLLRLPPGTGRGWLKAMPRDDALELRAILARLEEVRAILVSLGRGMEGSADDEAPERVGIQVERTLTERVRIRGPEGAEVRGVERSNEVARMLPSEAALLTHPVLRLLWHARRTENALFAYHAKGVWSERIRRTQRFEDGEKLAPPRAERVPVIVVLDTSGSMFGFPEAFGKAFVLQTMARCSFEERPCYVYNFSGPGDLVEHQLSFGEAGTRAFLRFLTMSFHGGTVIHEAIRRACERLKDGAWRQADVVIVSDGLFEAEPSRDAVAAAKKLGNVRFLGVRPGPAPPEVVFESDMREDTILHMSSDSDAPEPPDGFSELGCDEVYSIERWIRTTLAPSTRRTSRGMN
ncbi:MAG: VWA domain-containing protein [Myxococcota bacterium]